LLDVAHPIRSVVPTLDGPVLEVLARTTRPLSGREVHRLAGTGSPNGIRLVLARLAEQGLVYAEERAKAVFYTANRDHVAWPAVEILTGLRRTLLDRLRAELGRGGRNRSTLHCSGPRPAATATPSRTSMCSWCARTGWGRMSRPGLTRWIGSAARSGCGAATIVSRSRSTFRGWPSTCAPAIRSSTSGFVTPSRSPARTCERSCGGYLWPGLTGEPATDRPDRDVRGGAGPHAARPSAGFRRGAELVGTEQDALATPGVAAALAVLAGIAAADAACCAALGRRARGQDHRQALAMLAQVAPDGQAMSRDLDRLLAVKDNAHYGLLHVSGQRAAAALRQARRLVDTAVTHVH